MYLSEIAKVVDDSVLVGEDKKVQNLSLDTRTLQKGDCFVAIKGDNFDGHDFIEKAIEKGAGAFVVSNKEAMAPYLEPINFDNVNFDKSNLSVCVVPETLKALGQMGHAKRMQSKAKIVGLTGSCGKTTVKTMLASILSEVGETVATKGNFNNHIGLPLTLWAIEKETEYAVLEMGANHPGEIEYLSKLAKVDVALINNVAPAHLEGFGSVHDVASAKGEIFNTLKPNGLAVMNVNDPYCMLWQDLLKNQPRFFFSLDDEETLADIWASNIQYHPLQTTFCLKSRLGEESSVSLKVPGVHNVQNALAASTCAFALGVEFEKIVLGLEKFNGVRGRLCWLSGLNGAHLIDDTYNANPTSVEAALSVLEKMPGEKIFVLGQMAELGDEEVAWHQKVGKMAKAKGVDKLYVVGHLCKHTAEAFGLDASLFSTQAELIKTLKVACHPKATLLVKGSRSAKMEKIVEALSI